MAPEPHEDREVPAIDFLSPAVLDRTPTVILEDAVEQIDGICADLRRQQLAMIAALDRRESYTDDGAKDMAHALQLRRNWCRSRAARRVRTAHALDDLPKIAAAFSQGRLSEDQLHELCRHATPATDAELAADAPGWSYTETARRARLACGVSAEQAKADLESRRLSLRTTTDGPALEDPRGEAACSADPTGVGETEWGAIVPTAALKRLFCDARVQMLIRDTDGKVIALGTAVRTLPRRLRRLLRRRDGHCAFPGCDRTTHLIPHHIVHHAHGGPTDEDNLVMLCGFHHRCIHEGGFDCRGTPGPDGDLRFLRPDGRPVPTSPDPVRPEVVGRFRVPGPAPPGPLRS